jgi:hypothetical protein
LAWPADEPDAVWSGGRLGLDRLEEARLIDYAKGILLFVMMPGDPESGIFYMYDRVQQAFWMVDLPSTTRYGGYRPDEFEQLAQLHSLKTLAQDPQGFLPAHREAFENRRSFGV